MMTEELLKRLGWEKSQADRAGRETMKQSNVKLLYFSENLVLL
jgi:hypothetical protein